MQTDPFGAGGAILRPFFHDARRSARLLAAAAALVVAVLGVRPAPAGADSFRPGGKIVKASWYGREFAWRRTASGDRFDPGGLTGAHRTLPLGCKVRVTNLVNGRSVLVTINDRGPFRRQREIDLSYGAARALGMLRRGIAQVRIELIES